MGEYRIAAPREAVWKALNDADVLARSAFPAANPWRKPRTPSSTPRCAPRWARSAQASPARCTLSDLDPPNGYKISGEGQGGVAGFARGGADVRLKPDETGAGTILTYAVQANVGGKIAQIGSRLIESTARSMAEQFFGKFASSSLRNPAAGRRRGNTCSGSPGAQHRAQAALSQRVWVTLLIVIVALACSTSA